MLQFFDGFDHYNTTALLAAKWGGIASTPFFVTGRGGVGNAVRLVSNRACIRAVSGSPATVICGFAFKWLGGGNLSLFRALDGSTVHFQLYYENTTGKLRVYRNTTLLGESAAGVASGAGSDFIYIELRVTVDDSAGVVVVRVNGSEVINLTGQDTRNGAAAQITEVQLWGGIDGAFDDFYLCDTTGSVNNDFLGDVKVVTLYPNGAGDSTDFTPLSGSNYQNVDEVLADGDTTYVESSTVSDKDLYTFENLGYTPESIYGVQTVAVARKDDAGSREMRVITKSGATTKSGSSVALGTAYGVVMDFMETNPDDSAAWELADINALQAGVEVTA